MKQNHHNTCRSFGVLAGVLLTMLIGMPGASVNAADVGVTRTQIEGWDNWGWQGGPPSTTKIKCPGGELMEPFDCSDSMTGRLHLRDGAGWSCMTSSDSDLRMTGVGLYTSNGNFDADSNGPVWGEWKMVPMVGCNKDAVYTEEYEDLVNSATSFWYGNWNGQRQFDGDLNGWISELKVRGNGFGGVLDGLQFKGTMWITTYTPFPIPYEYIFEPGSAPFDMPEAYFIGTIKE